MNANYRTVWNEALGAWVAASEITRSKSKKTTRSVAIPVALLTGALMWAAPAATRANTITSDQGCGTSGALMTLGRLVAPNPTVGPTDGSGTFALVAGCNASGNAQDAPTVYGTLSQVTGKGGTALGFNVLASKWSLAAGLESRATGIGSTALGFGSAASALNSVAIGGAGGNGTTALSVANSTTASGTGAIAIGSNAIKGAQATAADAIAIGGQSSARGQRAIALGNGAQATGTQSISIGTGNVVSGNNSGAIGNPTSITGSSAYGIGNGNTINASNAFVLGNNVTVAAGLNGAVVLGNGSTVRAATATPSNVINSRTFTYAAAGAKPATGDVMSVGSATAPRQIQNVANGQVTATSLDAINGSQLWSVTDQLNTTVTANKTHYFGVNDNGVVGSNYNNDGATGLNALAAGVGAQAASAQSVAIGTNAGANGRAVDSSNVAVGSTAGQNVSGSNNAATGSGAGSTVTGNGNSSFGSAAGAKVTGQRNTTSGYQSGQSVTGDENVSSGFNAGQAVSGQKNISIGSFAGANIAANNTVAIGTQALASVDTAVALGSGSVADRAPAPATGSLVVGTALVPYNTTDRTLLGAVSVGSATSYRQITNVADGTQQQDAVTMRQLSGALQSFAVSGTKYFHANSSATDALAIGAESVAVGPQTVVNANNGVGIGNGAVVQQGATGGVAIGAGTNVTQTGGVALGESSVASTAAGVAGYIPPTATDAQRGAVAATTSTLAAVSVGDAANGQFRQITGVAAGTVDSDAANISQLKGVQSQVATIDQSSVKYETNADGTINYTNITMGGGKAPGPVTVHNVAPGVAGTDAVNVNQLNSGVASANAYTDSRVGALQNDLTGVAKKAYAGVAAAMALESAPYIAGKTTYAAGAGYYQSQGAVGLALRRTADSGRWSVTGGVSASAAGVAARVGISGVWD